MHKASLRGRQAAPNYTDTQKRVSRIDLIEERLARSEERTAQEFKTHREMQEGFAAVDRRLKEKDRRLKEKDRRLKEKAGASKEKDRRLKDMNKRIKDMNRSIKDMNRMNKLQWAAAVLGIIVSVVM